MSERDRAALQALIDAARARQRSELRKAQEHALRFVPGLLRKPLLKLLAD